MNDKGEKIQGWFPKPKPKPIWTHRWAAAVDSRRNIYFQEGTHPVAWIIPENSNRAMEWKLDIPKWYREPPNKPMDPAWRFDREKAKAYANSYTHLHTFAVVKDDFLAVLWQISEPIPYSFDIYSLATKKRVVANQTAPGWQMVSDSDMLYFLEIIESDDPERDGRARIHKYPINLLSTP